MASETTDALFARYGSRYRWLVSVAVLLGTVSAMVTTTIVNVAIPDIMGAFGIGQDRAQWFMTGALSAMTVGMLLNAWLIRNFGQRRTFVTALFVFVLSLLLAGPVGWLVIAYLGSLAVLFVAAFWQLDPFTAEVVRETSFDNFRPIAEGWFVHVFVDRGGRKSRPIPDGIRASLERLAA